ncbi:DNA-binding protein [Streptococcus acidominimus]|uniref:DNA-binding protein n=3 Tax=Streptococcus TaxID=1301 RepID=A0A1Q8E707_STRAI|nr:DNA-binding protein [Streptococcus acidominimus]TFU97433.1 DNA-binding protein [Streptococcus cuniculi]SUN08599.1 putative DNA-binding protein [Streptococcus acidominimus]
MRMNNYLLTRQQASDFLGIDPKSFDKIFRADDQFKRFMIGSRERYTRKELINFVNKKLV